MLKKIFLALVTFNILLLSQANFAKSVILIPPYDGLMTWHDEAEPELANFGIGDAYTTYYTPEPQRIVQFLTAQTWLAGTKKIQALDAIRKQFSVAASGYYEITFNGFTSGKVYIISSSYVGNAKGGADARIEASVGGVNNSMVSHPLYNTERSLGDVFDDVQNTYDQIEDIIQMDGISIAEDIINEMIDALEAVSEPETQWLDTPFSITTTVFLNAGTTYYWDLSLISSADSIAALNACNSTSMKLDVVLEEVTATPLGILAPPHIEYFHTTPSSVVQGAAFFLSVDASDSDGQPTRAEFYRDANGNGQLDVSDDLWVDVDTDYNLGFAYMGYANLEPGLYRYFVRIQDDDGLWSGPATTTLTVSPSPATLGSYLSLVGTDWNADEEGDEDGVIEVGEDVRLRLRIASSSDIGSFFATLSSSMGNLNISDNIEQYPGISAGENAWPYGSGFNMYLDLASTSIVPFNLHVEYTVNGQDYYQDFAFEKIFYENGSQTAAFEVVSFEIDDSVVQAEYNNGDGIIQSGEKVEIRPKLRNTGQAGATNIDAWLTYTGAAFSVDGTSDIESYPDLNPGQEEYPSYGSDYDIRDILKEYAGTQFIDFHVTYYQSQTEVVLPSAIRIDIQPVAWLSVPEDNYDFGVEAPGTFVTHTTQVHNVGSESLSITDIGTSNADTTWTGEPLPWVIAPGISRDLEITIDTTSLSGAISREITIISDGRVRYPGEDDKLIVSGLVSDQIAIFTVPIFTGFGDLDISGRWITYKDRRNGNADIFAYNTVTGIEHQITYDVNDQYDPFISGSLIAWKDKRNNPETDDSDIYAYDLDRPDLGVFLVSAMTGREDLIGVSDSLVAVEHVYETLYDDSSGDEAYNIHIYEYDGSGGFAETWSTGYTPGAGDNPRQNAYGSGYSADFNEGLLVFYQDEIFMYIQNDGDRTWQRRNGATYAIDFARGETSATHIFNGVRRVSAAAHRMVYSEESPEGDYEIWLWRPTSAPEFLVGTVDEDAADEVLAIGGPDGEDVVIYDWHGTFRPGLMYIDRENGGSEAAITTSGNPYAVRADNFGVVWRDYSDSTNLFYTYLKQSDISVSSAGISFTTENPVEGETIDVSVLVRNLSDYNLNNDITVRIFAGDPDSGATQLGVDHIISGGIIGNGQHTVNFSGVVMPDILGGSDEESLQIYARISVPGYDNPDNNTASRSITLYDNDTAGPVISNVLSEEYDGDGDGVIGADEKVKISWELADSTGIGTIVLSVDGTPINLEGNYYAILDSLNSGGHDFSITVADTDNSSASSQYDGSFNVVISEDIAVLYDGKSITNGSTVFVPNFLLGNSDTSIPFFIRNDGEQTLYFGNLTINVTEGNITSSDLMTTNLAAGNLTYFTITPVTCATGLCSAEISIDNSDSNENPFNFTIFVSTRIVDADGDGIDDNWEILHFSDLSTANSSSDFDKDGYTDLQEYLNDTAGELDPQGNEYDPIVPNAQGGTGYKPYGSATLPGILMLLLNGE